MLLHPLAAAIALFCCAAFGVPSQRVDYVLTPVVENGALREVEIDLTFRGEADGETKLRLPNEWGGETELWRGIAGLTAVSGAAIGEGANPHERILTHAPSARVHLRYRVIQDWEGTPSGEHNTYRPIIQPTYFHLIGEAAFVTPDFDNATPARVRVRHLPRGWNFASDLQHPGLALGNIWASVTVGGDYRIRWAEGHNVRVAIRGEWRFADEAFAAKAGEIIGGHRAFWGDRATPYLITVTQTVPPTPTHISVGGTGLGDAFAFFATPNADDAPITRTLAHESLHTWIPGAVGGMPEEDEAAYYWFSEGYTDFYTGRMLVREGLWSPQQFADDLNDMLTTYAQSPVREAPNSRIVADFWNDYAVQQLPYQRGRLLATIWDARLRAHGASLDDVMRRMRHRADQDDHLNATQLLPDVLGEMGLDIRSDVATYAENGARVLLPEDVFAPCGRIDTRDVPVFSRGFDIEATEAHNRVIFGVDPASPAYAAGLRDGMVLIRRDHGVIGDAEQEIAYVVRDGETERTIAYYPHGQGVYTRQRLEIDLALEGERLAQCRAVLGGASQE
jgi:predicted metalloprotease with PDZ domain